MRRGSIVRPNAHDWKSCEGNTSAGSNPALSASVGDAPQVGIHLWRFFVATWCMLPTWAHHSTSSQHESRTRLLPVIHAGCLSLGPLHTLQGNPTSIRRHGPVPIATATRAPCWRRHQQSPSATLATGWAYAKSAPGAMPHTLSGLGNSYPRTATHQAGVPETRLPYIQECFAAKRSTRPAAELAHQRSIYLV